MSDPERVPPAEALKRAQGGAMIVCAYDSQEQFQSNQLAGAIHLGELKERENDLARDHELIFYCA